MTLAFTRLPSPRMSNCQLTFLSRSPIDSDRALAQHVAYRCALAECGARVETLESVAEMPDCAFVEDAAVALDEVAVVCRPGTESRRGETAAIEEALRPWRRIERIEAPATLEGGDVLRVGRTLLVGLSSRTNAAGIERFQEIARPLGYAVRAVPVTGCLHLKTACTALPDGRLLMNRQWIDARSLHDCEQIAVPAAEPWGANVACLGDCVVASASNVRTNDLTRSLGFDVRRVDLEEFAKAEGGVTCLSILLRE